MSRIKLNIRQLPVPEKIAKARQISSALDGNEKFPSTIPSLAIVTAAIDACEAAFAAMQAARHQVKTRKTDLQTKEDVLDQLMVQLAGHVESVAGSDDSLIHSAGMETKSAPGAATLTDAPASLTATAGVHEGEIHLSWDRVVKAKGYVIEKSPDPSMPGSWAHAGVTIKASFTISGLPGNTRCWFRVASVGTRGQSGWSDPVARVAP